MTEPSPVAAELRRFAFAMEAANIGAWDWEIGTGAVWWSDNLPAVHGIDPTDFDGTFPGYLRLIHPDDRDYFTAAVTRAIDTGAGYEAEFRVRAGDGEVRWIAGKGQVVHDDAGKPVRMIGIGLDVTARREADAARRELAAIVTSSSDAIISRTLDGVITSWNRGAELLYGYPAAEVVGRSMTTLIPPDRVGELSENFDQIRRGEAVAAYETERLRRDGTIVPVSVSVSPIVDEGGRVVGAATISRDMTESRALARFQEDMLAMVTHDLTGPLTVIQSRAQLMGRRGAYDQVAVDAIVTQTERMARLLQDLSDAVRLDAGGLELRREPVDLVALAREEIASAGQRGGSATIRLEPGDEDTPVIGAWDRERLGQVLQNLIGNALKYGGQGGLGGNDDGVVVRVASEGGEARLSVADLGPGIAARHHGRLFDRFYRVDAGDQRPGLGMGLYISRMLVEAHGGRIWVESEPGQGSSFFVALPFG